jgi:ABC-type lipoprotein release transport system permease subunit
MFGPRHLVRRLLRQPLITASIVCGIALAVGLGIAGPLATNVLAALGLRATVEALPAASQNIQLTRTAQGFTQAYRMRVEQELGNLAESTYGVSYLPHLGARFKDLGLTVRLRSQENLLEHVTITGRAPEALAQRGLTITQLACGSEQSLEVMLSSVQVTQSRIAIGDRICVNDVLPVQLVGTWEPRDEQELYWFGDRRPLTGEIISGGAAGSIPVSVLMLTPNDFESVAQIAPKEQISYIVRIVVRPTAISLDTLAAVDESLRALRTQVASLQPRTTLLTGLDAAITTYNQRFRLLQSVLATLLLAIVMLALVYIILVGALATQQQSAELAMLRSRGASGIQVTLSQVAQACTLVVPGLVLGVGLGVVAVGALSRTALFERLRGQAGLEIRWTTSIIVLTAMILVAVVLGLVFAAWPALRQSLVILRQERARPPRRSGWRRAQFDFLIVFVAVLGWWQLRRYGSGLVSTIDGSTQFNLLSLAAPVLMLAAGAVIFLRIFPFAARGLGSVLARGTGIVTALGAWQLARNPMLYGRLVLLLILTVGLGVYSQTVSETIAREQLRQALDDAGADVRVELNPNDDVETITIQYDRASEALLARIDAEVMEKTVVIERQIGTATMMAVDGANLATVLEQSGSSNQPLLSALRRVSAGTTLPLGMALPTGAEALRVGIRGATSNIVMYAKVADVNGTYQVELGQPTVEWQVLEGKLPRNLREPVTLQSLLAVAPPNTTGVARPGLFLRQLEAVVNGTPVTLHTFEQIDEWEGVGTNTGRVNLVREPTAGETVPVVRMSFGSIIPGSPAAIRFRIETAVPVFSYHPASGISANPGQTLLLRVDDAFINVRVQERIARLPGEHVPGQTLLVIDLRRLDDVLTYGLLNTVVPTELRLALRPGASERAREPISNTTYTKASALLLRSSDPLSNGVRVILSLGFGAAVILSLVGFLTYAALTIRARQVEWSVLSALGIPTRDLLLLVVVEQGFVLASGLIAGLIVGIGLTFTTTPFLQIVARSSTLPTAVVDWIGLGVLVGAFVVALVGAMGILLVAMARRGLAQELRMGEA